jgi:hypothetical protein
MLFNRLDRRRPPGQRHPALGDGSSSGRLSVVNGDEQQD